MNFDGYPIDPVVEARNRFGTPLYLYNLDIIEANINKLRSAAPGFKIRYAVKTNPNPSILSWMKDYIDSVDVSSAGEIAHVRKLGWDGRDIEFTGPAKTARDLEVALDENIKSIVIEDLSEAVILNDIAKDKNITARILVRISPTLAEKSFGVRLAGRSTQFGVDQDKLPELFDALRGLAHIHVAGFHIYSGTQCLNDEALAEHFINLWGIFRLAMAQWREPVEELVFGAGMGIPFHDGDSCLELNHLPAAVETIRQDIQSLDQKIECFIELGRFLVGTAGLFVTSVVRVKESRGSSIAICDGGMNHNLGACGHLGGISHRHYSMLNITNGDKPKHTYRVVGPLCTAIDTLAHRIEISQLSAGDVIAVACAGSYGPTASPLFFISHELPHEVVFTESKPDGDGLSDASWLRYPTASEA